MGDRKRTMTQDDKLIFSSSINKLKDSVKSLETLSKNNKELSVKVLTNA